jgi:hypothetical protein
MTMVSTFPFYEGKKFKVMMNDLGDTWQLEGVLIGNGHDAVLMKTPDAPGLTCTPDIWNPTITELEAWLKQSDDPVAPLFESTAHPRILKGVVRKMTRQLDQKIVWACYARDNYTCVYCGATGVPLTYDHFLAQAFGGQTTMANGRTSCRRCNKAKGHMTIAEWAAYCLKKGLNDGTTITA